MQCATVHGLQSSRNISIHFVYVSFQLEEEVTNIYRVHEELKQTCERREKLERAARMRLQSDLQRVQELNCVMKDQVDILQSQLLAPSEHQILIAQLFTQSKSMPAKLNFL